MPRKMKNPTPQIEKPFFWCPPEWVKPWYLAFLNSARLRLGMQGRPWSAIAPSTVERMHLREQKKYTQRALERLLVTPDECLISFSVSPKGDDIDKTVAEFRRLRSKLLSKESRILAYMVVPEPRPIGTAHGNIIVKCLTTDAKGLMDTFERKLEKASKIYEFWKDPMTGELTNTHEAQLRYIRIGKVPGPIWYALKTTTTKVHTNGLQRHDIIAEVTRRAQSERHASAIEASAWRKYVGLNISFNHKPKGSSGNHASTLTYSKRQIFPHPSPNFLRFSKGSMLAQFLTLLGEKLKKGQEA